MANYYTHITQAGDTLTSIQNNGGTYNVGVSQAIDATTGTFSGAVSGTTGTFSGAVAGTTGTFSGLLTAASFSSNVKSFNIQHPTLEGKRLWHGCLEGPEHAVYIRGTMKDTSVINLPDYWIGLVDLETITVNLTPIGAYQELYVQKIEWGKKVIVKSSASGPVNCYYTVTAMRKDVPPLEIVQDA